MGEITPSLLMLQLMTGIGLGAVYALLALGLSLIFGMLNVVNFAHGAFFMVGAFMGVYFLALTGNFWFSLVLTPLAVGAIGLAALHRRLTWDLLWQGMNSTMRITAMVIFILIGSTVFGLVFRGMDGDLWIEQHLMSLPGGVTGFLIAVNLFIFVLAFFLDFFEIAFIVIPLLAPVAAKLGIDLIWFGVLLGANMQTSFMHPPFGFALFYLRGVAPKEVKSSDIYWGAVPWVFMQLLLVAILIFWPGLVTGFVDKPVTIDPAKIEIQLRPEDAVKSVAEPPAESTGSSNDGAAAIERMLNEQK